MLKQTTVKITEKEAIKITARENGHNLNTVVFNTDYLSDTAPELVPELYKLYKKVKKASLR